MTIDNVDSSALAKRYILEVGTPWFRRRCAVHRVATSAVAMVELASAFERLVRQGVVALTRQQAMLRMLELQLAEYSVVHFSQAIISDAARLVRSLPSEAPIRAMDAIHLASAQHIVRAADVAGVPFGALISSDHRLLAAAQSLGISTENPERYP